MVPPTQYPVNDCRPNPSITSTGKNSSHFVQYIGIATFEWRGDCLMKSMQHWQINPEITFLNHGCFGSVPRVVAKTQEGLRELLESDPIRFLAPERELEPKLDGVRKRLADFVGARPSDLAFVRNATDGVNAVLRSMRLHQGDEIVITNHGYNACNNVARFVAERSQATVRVAEVPYPLRDSRQVVESINSVMGDRTKLLLIDHVTSPTALVFPIVELIALAREFGARIMVDGAHALGMLPLQLDEWGPDYYTANHHKWLCSPKVSGLLYVRPELQEDVFPTVISHPYNRARPGRSSFTASFDWVGTYDPTPILSIPSALDFLGLPHQDGLIGHMRTNRSALLAARDLICGAMGLDSPAPDAMLGSMLSIPLNSVPVDQATTFHARLRSEFKIEVPVFAGVGDSQGHGDSQNVCDSHGPMNAATLMRISMQAYNEISDIEKLIDALSRLGAVNH
jgi:isopenicillin-N epimerase